MRKIIIFPSLLVISLIHYTVIAQEDSKTINETTTGSAGIKTNGNNNIPNSKDNPLPKGLLKFPYYLSADQYCIPAKVSLRLIGEDDSNYIVYRPDRTSFGKWLFEPDIAENSKIICHEGKTDEIKPVIPVSTKVHLKKSETKIHEADQFGWQYGGLIAPYKYYTSNDDLTGAATIAPYFGWRLNFPSLNFSFTPVLFAGPTMINATKSDGSSTNLFGLSSGAGVLMTLHQEFNMGFLLGYDVTSDEEEFENNGRPWISISFGLDFSK
ncbi:hypothetical protein KDD30_16860 (plasmid) [Photobacterium sp. GJ3]|uniref:hypothetical protein n=1 Tax=Photobacterium sp. GJ3 TaxID=2829502 RepID=UPI001B8DA3C0|nr:hypothetical protein [Photobacterium sp. GJ3]QUJ69844.1 hypothetical protein KDD30_16860 [Photobacterium sp. GJ3]